MARIKENQHMRMVIQGKLYCPLTPFTRHAHTLRSGHRTPFIRSRLRKPLTDQPNWQNDYKEWMQAFSAAMGQRLAFVHINWSKPDWQASVQQTVKFAKSVQLPMGIIYNGNVHGDPSPTTKKWLDTAAQNFTLIETKLGVVPDQVIFHSWEKFPPHLITDKSDLGEDYLVKQYIKTRLKP